MIIVKLMGGLGNQMFQYAAAIGQAETQEGIYLDHSFLEENNTDLEHFAARCYELHIFKNLKVCKAQKWQTMLFKSPNLLYRTARRLLHNRTKYVFQQSNEIVSLENLREKAVVYLDGYFQSESFFQHRRQTILQDFQFPELDPRNEAMKKKIQSIQNSVSLHIRRGDFEKSKVIAAVHGTLPLAYYRRALDLMGAKLGNLELFIFSDDAAWGRKNLDTSNMNAHFITHNHGADSWKDMTLMKCCAHQIIANSSFSWWGAWLNENPGKIIVAPKKWYNDPILNARAGTMMPDTWITL